MDRLVVRNSRFFHHPFHRIRRKDTHQGILERNEKLRLSRITLSSGAATQLIIDASRFMSFGTKNEKSSGGFDTLCLLRCRRISTKLYVDAATCHVGRYRDGAETAG